MGVQHGSEASTTRSYEERHVGVEELATRSLVDLQYDLPSTRSHVEHQHEEARATRSLVEHSDNANSATRSLEQNSVGFWLWLGDEVANVNRNPATMSLFVEYTILRMRIGLWARRRGRN
jgi:hypothetical protein